MIAGLFAGASFSVQSPTPHLTKYENKIASAYSLVVKLRSCKVPKFFYRVMLKFTSERGRIGLNPPQCSLRLATLRVGERRAALDCVTFV